MYPNNKEAKEKYEQCEKIIRKIAFENAISVEVILPSTLISKELESIEIDSSYEGIHMPSSPTEDFLKQLLESFKNQKKIHIKYVYQILLKVREILSKLPSLIEIEVPEGQIFNVCGDTHGQVIFFLFFNFFSN